MAENVLNLAKDTHRFKEVSKPQRRNTKKFKPRHITIKLLKTKDKVKVLKADRQEQHITHGG